MVLRLTFVVLSLSRALAMQRVVSWCASHSSVRRVVRRVAATMEERASFEEAKSFASDTGSSIRMRFAPSPTGSLHVGGARTALRDRRVVLFVPSFLRKQFKSEVMGVVMFLGTIGLRHAKRRMVSSCCGSRTPTWLVLRGKVRTACWLTWNGWV